MEISWKPLDEQSIACALRIRPADIVLLQAYLETYEHLAFLRTLEKDPGVIAIICSKDMQESCEAALGALSAELQFEAESLEKYSDSELLP